MHGAMKIEREITFSASPIKKNFVVFFLHNLTYPNHLQSFFLLFPVILVTEYPLLGASNSFAVFCFYLRANRRADCL